MNFLKKLVGPRTSAGDVLPVSEESFECLPGDCHFKYPGSCFAIKGPAATEPLWESSKTPDLRIIVKSGKTDWGHDALNDGVEPDSLLPVVHSLGAKLAADTHCNVSCNVSSEGFDHTSAHYADYVAQKCVDILILPWFVRVNGITADNIEAVYKVLTAAAKDAPKGTEGKYVVEKMQGLPVEAVMDHNAAFILLCSHNTRDKKCGQTAPYMRKEFESQLGDHGLHRDANDTRPEGARVLFINHVGGHKFAANVLIHKRNGEFVWFARCTPLNVKAVVEETVIAGKVFPDNVRTCKKFASVEW